jgi:hypothetical protein
VRTQREARGESLRLERGRFQGYKQKPVGYDYPQSYIHSFGKCPRRPSRQTRWWREADSNRRSLSQNEPVSLAERECRRGERAISKARSILGETEGLNPISSSGESDEPPNPAAAEGIRSIPDLRDHLSPSDRGSAGSRLPCPAADARSCGSRRDRCCASIHRCPGARRPITDSDCGSRPSSSAICRRGTVNLVDLAALAPTRGVSSRVG